MKLNFFKIALAFTGVVALGSCKKMLDINKDPDRISDSNSPITQLLTSAQVNIGFTAGSDLYRNTTLIIQQMSGGASQPNQTYEYGRYNITGSDLNNLWSSIYATTLSDLELIIKNGGASPHFVGVAKILKAFTFHQIVDTWGDVPYSATQQLSANTQPAYDDDATIYPKLITLLAEAVTDMNAGASALSPGVASVMYTNLVWATARPFWIKLANTLRLRLLIHYSKRDPAFCVAQITALVNTPGITFMTSNADSYQMTFYNIANQRNSISAFEVSRPNYLFADRKMVEMMNAKADPRRATYFTLFPYIDFVPFALNTSAASTGNTLTYSSVTGVVVGATVTGAGIPPHTIVKTIVGNVITVNDDETPGYALPAIAAGTSITFQQVYRTVSAAKIPLAPNNNYSRIHTFLRGALTTAPVGTNSGVYSGAALQRLLPYAEYCFIRAEAALMGAPGSAQTFFTDGITASMTEAGVSGPNITTYLTANGTLTGTNAQRLQQIIEEKYIALFGVSGEPWADWRRTGYPALTPAVNGITSAIPRTFFYPQSEIDLNPSNPGQKAASLQDRVFWDN
ncbi:MAG: SusD/RagB family nutrient-binding outer membrane lipoprotein [Bacteroidota bacterium]|nr:SusD/RagB family nutrient-binding outer membrane lipoprotein [Bacteroidota bacterium]